MSEEHVLSLARLADIARRNSRLDTYFHGSPVRCSFGSNGATLSIECVIEFWSMTTMKIAAEIKVNRFKLKLLLGARISPSVQAGISISRPIGWSMSREYHGISPASRPVFVSDFTAF